MVDKFGLLRSPLIAAVVVAAVIGAAVALVPSRRAASAEDGGAVVELPRVARFDEGFGFVQSVRELSDGTLFVADPLGGLFVRVDLHEGTVLPVGREGAGPDEWRQPDAVLALPGDSTLLVDLGNTRLTVVDPDGRFIRSHPMALAPAAAGRPAASGPMAMAAEIVNPRVTDAAGHVYYQGRSRAAIGPGGPAGGAPGADSAEVRRWDPATGEVARLAGLRRAAVATASPGGAAQMAVRMRPIPLSPQDDWAVAPDGRIALVRAEPYRVEWLHADGSVRRGPAIEFRAVPVGGAEKERWLQASGSALSVMMTVQNGVTNMQLRRGGGRAGAAAADASEYEWPATLPAFRAGSARVDPAGRLWVERYERAGAPVVHDVFDGEGARIAQVRLPADRRIIGFGRAALYAVHEDELGLHRIEAYEPLR
jgi:hypothetical protein